MMLMKQYQKFIQLPTAEQTKDNLCGFHALFSAIAQDRENKEQFWIFYKNIVNTLKLKYENDFKDEFEELQRYHLDYLLQEQDQFKHILKLHYGFSIIQLSEDEMFTIQNKIDQLRRNEINELIFICGITIHYVCIIVNNDSIILIDSRPNDIVNLMTGDMKQFYKEVKDGKELFRYQQFHEDLKRVLKLLERILSGQTQIIDEYIDGAIENLNESFEYFGFDRFIEDEYPPAVIKSMVINYLVKYQKKCPDRLKWLLTIQDERLIGIQGELRSLI